MNLISSRSIPWLLLCTLVAGAVPEGTALSQPGAPGPGAPAPGPGGGGPGGPGPGGPSPTFALRFCNRTKDVPVVYVAIISTVGQQFRVQGWTQIPQGQCVSVGTFPRPAVWWHARTAKESWSAKTQAADLCVDLNAAFDYLAPGTGRACTTNETLVPFYQYEADPKGNAFDLALD